MKRIKSSESEIISLTANREFQHICDLLKAGGIAAIPTETVYGLAADSANEAAVAKIFAAKGRPSFNPLIVHVPNIGAAQKLVQWNDMAQKLADEFWPGALTMVLPALGGNGIADNVSADLPTLALRCPAHPIMRAILAETGLNLAAPSANRSGQLSATNAQHVRDSFGDNTPAILDGGVCEKGLESTIVALRSDGWEILRPGPITHAMIENCLGSKAIVHENMTVSNEVTNIEATIIEAPITEAPIIEAPGQLSSHYAPRKSLRLNVDSPSDDEYYIALGDAICDYNLSLSMDMDEAASNLFAALHQGDNSNAISIAIAPIADDGVGIAINDRLKRAAVKA